MAKVISQDTFDDVVKENIVEFDMSPEEARQETINQFEAQGINLANIIKDLTINAESGKPILNESIDNLKVYLDEKCADKEKLLNLLKTIEDECQKSLPHRVLAAKYQVNCLLLQILDQQLDLAESKSNTDVIEATLKTLNSLYNKQPDIFDATALALAKRLLDTYVDNDQVICLSLQWLQKCCVMHEMNRQNIIKANIIEHLKPFVSKDKSSKVLRDALTLCRYLVLDDDIRVEFGCAHEHARQLAAEFIVDLTNLLAEFEEVTILADLLLTIGTLAVRQEFCTTVDEAGGIKLVLGVMENNTNNVRLNREALKLLRALAGHDAVKCHIVQQGVAPVLKELLHTHMSNENLVVAALACISTLTLRVKDNSKTLFDTGISENIVEAMRLHQKNKFVQRNGAWAIRNMVSRSREQCDTWLSFGVEDVLNTAISEHPTILQDVKAALRDLGCKVDLKEEWTGTAEKKIINN
ncbi:putative armadillo repeat-containing protein 6 [Lucilia cuprina]|uniref:Putative armadillo repeat-containing protein 6 n=1 Tax=Lucilia cuprina TaxID=7375 RepID=A0A0L0CMN5_LUCCU|nr:Armadillo repeat-containing protein 6 like protein [Lucilia cuprina]KNC33613.1 putative armadillo repeat-containing protein 6 [Lucilia cuprina]